MTATHDVLLLGAVAVGAAVLLTLPAPVTDTREAAPDDLVAPPWPFPDAGLEIPSMTALPGGHNEFDNQIRYACSLYGMGDPLAPVLVKAIITHESGWNPRALNNNPPVEISKGLMQVNALAHPRLDAAYDLFDPNQNILAGGQLLAVAYVWWPDWSRVLVGYNGPSLALSGVRENSYSRAVGTHFRQFAAEGGIAV